MKSFALILSFIVLICSGCGGGGAIGETAFRSVPITSHGPCKSISGSYMDKGLLSGQFSDSSVSTAKKFSVVTGFGRTVPQLSLRADQLADLRAISKKEIIAAQMKNYAAQRDQFDLISIAVIDEHPSGLDLLLKGGDGLPYKQIHISYDHENVGCDTDGHLVLRKVSHTGGAEMTPRQLDVLDSVFVKRPDGDLEIRKQNKNLIEGVRRQKTKWEGSDILIFPSVK